MFLLKTIRILGAFLKQLRLQEIWKKELSTSQLNLWLKKAIANHTPPVVQGGRRMRLKYITQTGAKPPTFTIFCNSSAGLAEATTVTYIIHCAKTLTWMACRSELGTARMIAIRMMLNNLPQHCKLEWINSCFAK